MNEQGKSVVQENKFGKAGTSIANKISSAIAEIPNLSKTIEDGHYTMVKGQSAYKIVGVCR